MTGEAGVAADIDREVELTLTVRVVSDGGDVHVEGTVVGADGESRAFAGWMDLLDRVESLVAGPAAETGGVS